MPNQESTVSTTSQVGIELFKEHPDKYLLNFSPIKTNSDGQQELARLVQVVFDGDDKSSTEKTKTRGDRLEDLGHHLLLTSGMFQNVRNNSKGAIHELDHACDFNQSSFELVSEGGILKSKRVLGESKNYKDEKIDVNIMYKVGAVSHFQEFSLSIIFSRKGLTGGPLKAASGVALKFRHNTNLKVYIIVFNDEDYEILKAYPASFNLIFYRKWKRFLDHDDYNIDYDELRATLEEFNKEGLFTPKVL